MALVPYTYGYTYPTSYCATYTLPATSCYTYTLPTWDCYSACYDYTPWYVGGGGREGGWGVSFVAGGFSGAGGVRGVGEQCFFVFVGRGGRGGGSGVDMV